jgi:hypothetical protein
MKYPASADVSPPANEFPHGLRFCRRQWGIQQARLRGWQPHLSAGMAIGCTLPQSAPLYTDEDSMVYSIGLEFGPICMVPTK